jgi:hypothetical protein
MWRCASAIRRTGGALARRGHTCARHTPRADGLPDDLLKDIGLTRSDIPFVVDAIASGDAERADRQAFASRSLP